MYNRGALEAILGEAFRLANPLVQRLINCCGDDRDQVFVTVAMPGDLPGAEPLGEHCFVAGEDVVKQDRYEEIARDKLAATLEASVGIEKPLTTEQLLTTHAHIAEEGMVAYQGSVIIKQQAAAASGLCAIIDERVAAVILGFFQLLCFTGIHRWRHENPDESHFPKSEE
jgi:hypothetical protein